MTKDELIKKIAGEMGLTKAAVNGVLDSLIEQAAETLKKEKRFALPGLGVFEVVERPARTGRNPQTGQPLEISASRAVKFKAAKALKDSVQ